MKNILKIIVTIILITVFSSQASATSSKNQIFKELAITTTKIEEDYNSKWIKYNKALDNYFIKMRYYKKRSDLKKLEDKLEPILEKYNNKSYLSPKEEKEFNLIKNIYYRSKILSLYYIK